MYNIHNCTEAMALDHSTPSGVACAGNEKNRKEVKKTTGYIMARYVPLYRFHHGE